MPRGHADDPYPDIEIEAKFLSLTAPVWGESHAQAMMAVTRAIDGAADMREFYTLLAKGTS